jgi:hypothetical protein
MVVLALRQAPCGPSPLQIGPRLVARSLLQQTKHRGTHRVTHNACDDSVYILSGFASRILPPRDLCNTGDAVWLCMPHLPRNSAILRFARNVRHTSSWCALEVNLCWAAMPRLACDSVHGVNSGRSTTHASYEGREQQPLPAFEAEPMLMPTPAQALAPPNVHVWHATVQTRSPKASWQAGMVRGQSGQHQSHGVARALTPVLECFHDEKDADASACTKKDAGIRGPNARQKCGGTISAAQEKSQPGSGSLERAGLCHDAQKIHQASKT